VKFFDSAFHLNIIPDKSDVMLYGDGAETGFQVHYPYHRFGKVRWITVLGTGSCGAADYEAGNPIFAPGELSKWVKVRLADGYRARVYCGRNNLLRCFHELGSLAQVERLIWWIPTLDGNSGWTADKLSHNIAVEEGLSVPAHRIWGVQYAGGPTAKVDTSLLLGTW